MIQPQTRLKVADNTGARSIQCIRVMGRSLKTTAGVGDVGHVDALEVFLVGLGDEVGRVGRVDADCHALLRLGNGELGAVEAIVFLRHRIEVDVE